MCVHVVIVDVCMCMSVRRHQLRHWARASLSALICVSAWTSFHMYVRLPIPCQHAKLLPIHAC